MACPGGSRGAALEQHPVGSVAGAGQVLREQQVPAAARDTAVVAHCHVRSRSGPGGLPVTWALQGRRECNPTRSVGSPDTPAGGLSAAFHACRSIMEAGEAI